VPVSSMSSKARDTMISADLIRKAVLVNAAAWAIGHRRRTLFLVAGLHVALNHLPTEPRARGTAQIEPPSNRAVTPGGARAPAPRLGSRGHGGESREWVTSSGE